MMFVSAGLSAGESIGVEDMSRILDGWLRHEYSPASQHLRRLWLRGDDDIHERISAVAVIELEAWSGEVTDHGVSGHEALARTPSRLTAVLRILAGRQLEIGLEFRSEDATTDTVDILSQSSAQALATLATAPSGTGWQRVEGIRTIDPGSLLASPVRLRPGRSGLLVTHPPKALYVFAKDEASRVFVERERVVLGADLILLVVDRLLADVNRALASTARPGVRQWSPSELSGVPPAWTLLTGVQVLAVPPESDLPAYSRELNALLPVALSQLTIAGGLALPGFIRKWSSLAPPEIRATNEGGRPMTISLASAPAGADNADASPSLQAQGEQGIAVLQLADRGLRDGDYEVTAKDEGSSEPPRRRTLRLRSAETPPASAAPARLGHYPGRVLWPLSASVETEGASPAVEGAVVRGGHPLEDDGWHPREPRWRRRDRSLWGRSRTEPVSLGILSDSCVTTGAHVMLLPPTGPDQPVVATFIGRCANCGLVKRYPAKWRGGRTRRSGRPLGRPHVRADLSALPPSEQAGDLATAALDGVFHLRGGTMDHLEQLAFQVEASSTFRAGFIRGLESIGDIEVARDAQGLRPEKWHESPATFVTLQDGAIVIVGHRERRLLDALAACVAEVGGRLEIEAAGDTLPRASVRGVSQSDVTGLAAAVAASCGIQAEVSIGAAERLASLLPRLSEVIAELPTTSIPTGAKVEMWDVQNGRWVNALHANRPGAYRFQAHGRLHGFRPPQVEIGEMLVGDNNLVRFAAALSAGEPLASYDEDRATLEMPLGVELPGLYGRAAALASGRPPWHDRAQGVASYGAVSRPLAYALLRKLGE